MSGLFGTLSMAARSLETQRFGLDVVGQNIANVNTAGFTRRTVDFVALPPTSALNAGGGVDVQGVRAIRDALLDRRLWQEQPAAAMQGAIADALGIVEVALGDPGTSLDLTLTEFFDAWGRLSEDPTSTTARQEVILKGEAVAAGFGDMAARVTQAQRDTDTRIRGVVDQVNALTTEIAGLNTAIARGVASGTDVQVLRDRQAEAITSLSRLMNVDVIAREDGGYDVTVGLGRPLVIGTSSFEIVATPTGPSGLVTLTASGVDVGGEIASGTLGGLLQVRDALIPGYLARLDELAHAVATEVNTRHEAAFDLNGDPGLAFFEPPVATSGAAAALAVNAVVSADAALVAAASTATSGDNQAARGLAALRDERVLFGGTATLHDAWGRLMYQAGTDTQVARQDERTRREIVMQVEALRDSVSGVSLDEEAANMIRFQRAYEANAQFFSTVDSVLQTLLTMVGR
jgi:flagellar hook-associated protein 1 FlgK